MKETLFKKKYSANNIKIIQDVVNKLFIARYGNIENAESEFNKILNNCKTTEDLIVQIESDFFIPEINQVIELLKNLTSFSEIIKQYSSLKIEVQKIVNNSNRSNEFKKFFPIYFSILNEYIEKNNIKRDSKNKYSLKEIREELGFPNKRTFNKWLSYFYDDKYNKKRIVSVAEYADIFKKFFLDIYEEDFEIEKFENVYLTRLNNEKRLKKVDLKLYAQDDYKLLKADIKDVDEEFNLNLPKNVDSYPFSIANQLIQHLV